MRTRPTRTAIVTKPAGVTAAEPADWTPTDALSTFLYRSADRVGYLLKDRLADGQQLIEAAQRVAASGSAIDPAVVEELARARRRDDRITHLTKRERQALALIAEGRSNRSIADTLGITTKTLESMYGSIFSKLGLEEDPDVYGACSRSCAS